MAVDTTTAVYDCSLIFSAVRPTIPHSKLQCWDFN